MTKDVEETAKQPSQPGNPSSDSFRQFPPPFTTTAATALKSTPLTGNRVLIVNISFNGMKSGASLLIESLMAAFGGVESATSSPLVTTKIIPYPSLTPPENWSSTSTPFVGFDWNYESAGGGGGLELQFESNSEKDVGPYDFSHLCCSSNIQGIIFVVDNLDFADNSSVTIETVENAAKEAVLKITQGNTGGDDLEDRKVDYPLATRVFLFNSLSPSIKFPLKLEDSEMLRRGDLTVFPPSDGGDGDGDSDGGNKINAGIQRNHLDYTMADFASEIFRNHEERAEKNDMFVRCRRMVNLSGPRGVMSLPSRAGNIASGEDDDAIINSVQIQLLLREVQSAQLSLLSGATANAFERFHRLLKSANTYTEDNSYSPNVKRRIGQCFGQIHLGILASLKRLCDEDVGDYESAYECVVSKDGLESNSPIANGTVIPPPLKQRLNSHVSTSAVATKKRKTILKNYYGKDFKIGFGITTEEKDSKEVFQTSVGWGVNSGGRLSRRNATNWYVRPVEFDEENNRRIFGRKNKENMDPDAVEDEKTSESILPLRPLSMGSSSTSNSKISREEEKIIVYGSLDFPRTEQLLSDYDREGDGDALASDAEGAGGVTATATATAAAAATAAATTTKKSTSSMFVPNVSALNTLTRRRSSTTGKGRTSSVHTRTSSSLSTATAGSQAERIKRYGTPAAWQAFFESIDKFVESSCSLARGVFLRLGDFENFGECCLLTCSILSNGGSGGWIMGCCERGKVVSNVREVYGAGEKPALQLTPRETLPIIQSVSTILLSTFAHFNSSGMNAGLSAGTTSDYLSSRYGPYAAAILMGGVSWGEFVILPPLSSDVLGNNNSSEGKKVVAAPFARNFSPKRNNTGPLWRKAALVSALAGGNGNGNGAQKCYKVADDLLAEGGWTNLKVLIKIGVGGGFVKSDERRSTGRCLAARAPSSSSADEYFDRNLACRSLESLYYGIGLGGLCLVDNRVLVATARKQSSMPGAGAGKVITAAHCSQVSCVGCRNCSRRDKVVIAPSVLDAFAASSTGNQIKDDRLVTRYQESRTRAAENCCCCFCNNPNASDVVGGFDGLGLDDFEEDISEVDVDVEEELTAAFTTESDSTQSQKSLTEKEGASGAAGASGTAKISATAANSLISFLPTTLKKKKRKKSSSIAEEEMARAEASAATARRLMEEKETTREKKSLKEKEKMSARRVTDEAHIVTKYFTSWQGPAFPNCISYQKLSSDEHFDKIIAMMDSIRVKLSSLGGGSIAPLELEGISGVGKGLDSGEGGRIGHYRNLTEIIAERNKRLDIETTSQKKTENATDNSDSDAMSTFFNPYEKKMVEEKKSVGANRVVTVQAGEVFDLSLRLKPRGGGKENSMLPFIVEDFSVMVDGVSDVEGDFYNPPCTFEYDGSSRITVKLALNGPRTRNVKITGANYFTSFGGLSRVEMPSGGGFEIKVIDGLRIDSRVPLRLGGYSNNQFLVDWTTYTQTLGKGFEVDELCVTDAGGRVLLHEAVGDDNNKVHTRESDGLPIGLSDFFVGKVSGNEGGGGGFGLARDAAATATATAAATAAAAAAAAAAAHEVEFGISEEKDSIEVKVMPELSPTFASPSPEELLVTAVVQSPRNANETEIRAMELYRECAGLFFGGTDFLSEGGKENTETEGWEVVLRVFCRVLVENQEIAWVEALTDSNKRLTVRTKFLFSKKPPQKSAETTRKTARSVAFLSSSPFQSVIADRMLPALLSDREEIVTRNREKRTSLRSSRRLALRRAKSLRENHRTRLQSAEVLEYMARRTLSGEGTDGEGSDGDDSEQEEVFVIDKGGSVEVEGGRGESEEESDGSEDQQGKGKIIILPSDEFYLLIGHSIGHSIGNDGNDGSSDGYEGANKELKVSRVPASEVKALLSAAGSDSGDNDEKTLKAMSTLAALHAYNDSEGEFLVSPRLIAEAAGNRLYSLTLGVMSRAGGIGVTKIDIVTTATNSTESGGEICVGDNITVSATINLIGGANASGECTLEIISDRPEDIAWDGKKRGNIGLDNTEEMLVVNAKLLAEGCFYFGAAFTTANGVTVMSSELAVVQVT